jgi:hypothetical protein
VSHQPLRTETNCLNCGTDVAGRFCQNCGQENIVNKQSAWALMTHFVYDIFHFDGKFFETVKYLLTRPGRVALDYINGRRARYLDPIRMYLFTSALFFLIFFSVNSFEFASSNLTNRSLTRGERFELAATMEPPADSVTGYRLRQVLDPKMDIYLDDADEAHRDSLVRFRGKPYAFKADIDSSAYRKSDWLAGKGWFRTFLRERIQKLREKQRTSEQSMDQLLLTGVMHRLPYMLFVSLPFFAMLLKLLYIRRRNFYYANHLVFTLYHYIFNFIMLLLVMGSVALSNRTGLDIFDWLTFALLTGGLIYLYKGMRNFYGQGRMRTLVKFLVLNFLSFWLLVTLFVIFFIISALQVH